jgi:hypothetical protein
MEDWKERLIGEARDLADRLERLDKFIHSSAYYDLAQPDRLLLAAQHGAMSAYGAVLALRKDRALTQ